MICLIDAQETAGVGLRRRLKRAMTGSRCFKACDAVVLGVRMLHITLKPSPSMKAEKVRRMIRYAAESMHEKRVHDVCFAKNFPYRSLFLGEGFDEMGSSLLTTMLAGRIVSRFGGDGRYAALFTRNLTVAALRTLSELCASFQYLMVTTETSSGREFDALRRRTGISVLEQPTSRQLQNADVAVIFGPLRRPAELPAKCIVLGVGDDALQGVACERRVKCLTLELTGITENGLPDSFPREILFSAALTAGTLNPEDIVIREVLLTG